ncbi:MAG TPA: hypothetical protein VNB49_02300, partial [Candidatus Dormibacteraeota bacterium]|nr:hypothetical protein [Candidatus Dormibacteraeota bacterium]
MKRKSAILRGVVRDKGLAGGSVRVLVLLFASIWATAWAVNAQTEKAASSFLQYIGKCFDYADFTRFDTAAPPKDGIYQSNGFMALRERGFGGQILIIAAPVDEAPTNVSDRLLAMEIYAPVFLDGSHRTYKLADSPAKRHLTYYADRTIYRAAFDGGPDVSLTVYPVYGKSAAVLRIKVEKLDGPLAVTLPTRGTGFQILPSESEGTSQYGSPRWPYRLLLGTRERAKLQAGTFEWKLDHVSEVSVIIALGGTEREAEAALQQVRASRDLLDHDTHQAWNDYLASTPLVIPAEPIKFMLGTSGEQKAIAPAELVRSELWFWRGVLSTICQVPYLPAVPMMIADWHEFMGMWANDGVSEAVALSATSRKDLARAAIVNWFRYSVNARGDGSAAWTIFPSGRNTYQAKGSERETEGVPLQAALVGQYVRLTGDTTILDQNLGIRVGHRTLWEALLAYQRNLLKVRDINHDHLIDWTHTWETGWDDKNSPFVDNKHAATSAINEQVFNLWSLAEMIYLSRLRGEDPSEWEQEFAIAKEVVRSKLWDAETQRYWDLDISSGKLWTQGENLDAYYLLYYESDPARIAAMMRRLRDPKKFNGALLPTLAFDTPKWGGYWRGAAWPREISYVALGLARAGQTRDAFEWLARALQTNLGPLLPETVDPKAYPPNEHPRGGVRILGYDALDCLAFADVAGLRIWAADDLTVAP